VTRELLATAISNAQARSDLAASRARIVAATDEERRRVVRDLHYGAQQRLVHTVIMLKLARRALEKERDGDPALLAEALGHAEQVTAELREFAHRILPAVLTQGGLRAGVDALRVADAGAGRLRRVGGPAPRGGRGDRLLRRRRSAHQRCEIRSRRTRRGRRVASRTTAFGSECATTVSGARADGSGLVGLADRVAALDGRLMIESPADGGTLVAADIPVPVYDRCVPLSMNRPWRSLILSSPASGRRRRWPGHDPTPKCNRPSA
jgi:signal transduction histidine kinase